MQYYYCDRARKELLCLLPGCYRVQSVVHLPSVHLICSPAAQQPQRCTIPWCISVIQSLSIRTNVSQCFTTIRGKETFFRSSEEAILDTVRYKFSQPRHFPRVFQKISRSFPFSDVGLQPTHKTFLSLRSILLIIACGRTGVKEYMCQAMDAEDCTPRIRLLCRWRIVR